MGEGSDDFFILHFFTSAGGGEAQGGAYVFDFTHIFTSVGVVFVRVC